MKIKHIVAREIFDSRGTPTIECALVLDDGTHAQASVPSGASRSAYEAHEMRDVDRMMGTGVMRAIENIEHFIAPALLGKEANVVDIDAEMIALDDTSDKSHLGGNAMLAVSMAVCRAQALANELELYELIAHLCEFDTVTIPGPMFNMINGGAHANNPLQIQEYMVMPIGLNSFREAMEWGAVFNYSLKSILQKHNKSTTVGDEGGFAPHIASTHEALDYCMEAIDATKKVHDASVMIALDVAASHFYSPEDKTYMWEGKKVDAQGMTAVYKTLAEQYPIYSIEDGLHEDDMQGWASMMKTIGNTVMKLVGDDLFATNPQRIWEGIENNLATCAIIKPNQIGTVTETLQAIKLCKEYKINVIASHRSGETNDDFIADLAVGASAHQIKAGGFSRGERMAKYNRLLAIEDELMFS